MGGLSWLGYYSYFILKKKLTLYIHESLVSDLWAMLRPAMEKLDCDDRMMTLDDYFEVEADADGVGFFLGRMTLYPIRQTHVETSHGNMYSYGLRGGLTLDGEWGFFISSDSKKVYIPITDDFTDAEYDYKCIFCDCDVMNLSGVHPNYNELKEYDADAKSRMWLYHYTDLNDYDGKFGEMPDAVADGFAGFVKEGQIFEI